MAYASDCRQLAAGLPRAASSPPQIDIRALRRYVGRAVRARERPEHDRAQARGDAGAVPQSDGARRARREPGRPAQLAQAPAAAAARAEGRPRSRRCSMRSRPRRRWSCATARCSSSRTRRACAPRSSCRSTSSAIDFDAEAVRVEGKGARRGSSRSASTRWRRSSATWSAPARARWRDDRTRDRALFLSKSGRRLGDLRRAPAPARLGAARRGPHAAARAARIRTRCGTRSPRICSRAAPTCARSRSCWATPRSRPRRFTLALSRAASDQRIRAPIPAPEAG